MDPDARPMQIWAVGTLRNEADLVRLNVLHHLSEGIDRFLFLDNGSQDTTREKLRELSLHFPIEWEEASGSFHQQALLTRLARTAAARGADWIIPIDADEFWCAPGSCLRRVLAATDAAALQVEVVNFIQRRDVERVSPVGLLQMVKRTPAPMGEPDEIANLVDTNRIAYVEIRYPPKCIARASTDLVVGWGNHDLGGAIGPRERTSAIVCLHAPLRAKHTLAQKTDPTRAVEDLADYLSKAWHIRRWRRLADAGALEDEWRANSQLDGALDVYGHRHDLIDDPRLHDLLAVWIDTHGPEGGINGVTLDPVMRDRIVDAAHAIDGWFERDELTLLIDVVTRAALSYGPRPTVVEIGSYKGRSTVALGMAIRSLGGLGRVHAIDPHQGEVGGGDSPLGLDTHEPTLEVLRANVQRHGLEGIVELIQARSTEVAWRSPIHLLLVDGLHDYDSVVADICHYEPWLARGAYVVLHDASDEFPGVRASIRAMLDTHAYVIRARQTSLVVLQHVGELKGLSADCTPTGRLEARLGVMDETVHTLRHRLAMTEGRLARSLASLSDSESALARAHEAIESLEHARTELLQSRTWRWTAPLRAAVRVLTGR